MTTDTTVADPIGRRTDRHQRVDRGHKCVLNTNQQIAAGLLEYLQSGTYDFTGSDHRQQHEIPRSR
jgi:hypothetical protein